MRVFFYQPQGIRDEFEAIFSKIHANKSIFKVTFHLQLDGIDII